MGVSIQTSLVAGHDRGEAFGAGVLGVAWMTPGPEHPLEQAESAAVKVRRGGDLVTGA